MLPQKCLIDCDLMMETKKTARRKAGGPSLMTVNKVLCKFWLAGRCNRNPCRFLHSELQPKRGTNPNPKSEKNTLRNPHCTNNPSDQEAVSPKPKFEEQSVVNPSNREPVRNPHYTNNPANQEAVSPKPKFEEQSVVNPSNQEAVRPKPIFEEQSIVEPKLCQHWISGDCVDGDKCKDLHSWFCGSKFSLLAKLEGHKKVVTGIALPSGSDKLLSGSKDESVLLWDCRSGLCVQNVKLSSEIKCMISEGPWVFVGLQNAVRGWNFGTQSELLLDGPNGLVYALATAMRDDILFAGVQDGSILAWKSNFESNRIELAATLKGHTLSVLSLVVGCVSPKLFSGSKDKSIRVWDVKTLQCLHTLNGHTDFITSVICWEKYLLSASLDNTLKVWVCAESGELEVVHQVEEEYGILALSGMRDPEGVDILFCSRKDNAVRLYELPTFLERGRIFSKTEIQAVQVGPDGLFFTGDAAGQLFVWKFN